MKKIVLFSNRRTSPKIALFEQSEFAILEGSNFCNEIFGQEFLYLQMIHVVTFFGKITLNTVPIISPSSFKLSLIRTLPPNFSTIFFTRFSPIP